MSTKVLETRFYPEASRWPRSTIKIWTGTPVATEIEAAKGEVEEKEPLGLLVASIILMVLICGLFGYVMYLERVRETEALARPGRPRSVRAEEGHANLSLENAE
jgi:hypothetical protein